MDPSARRVHCPQSLDPANKWLDDFFVGIMSDASFAAWHKFYSRFCRLRFVGCHFGRGCSLFVDRLHGLSCEYRIFYPFAHIRMGGDHSPFWVYPNNLKNWFFGCAKAPGFDDRKEVRIALILTSLRSIEPRGVSRGPKNNFSNFFGLGSFIFSV